LRLNLSLPHEFLSGDLVKAEQSGLNQECESMELVKIQMMFENAPRTSHKNFSAELEDLNGELLELSRIPCEGELISFPDGKLHSAGPCFTVIEVVHFASPSKSGLVGEIKLRKCFPR
jgi:hypothetical protein